MRAVIDDRHDQDQRDAPPELRTSTRYYSKSEAARLEGVSHHTVARVVRIGKVPAERFGRRMLIADGALCTWPLMIECAPRTYRRRLPDSDAVPALIDLDTGERVDTAMGTSGDGSLPWSGPDAASNTGMDGRGSLSRRSPGSGSRSGET